MTYDEAVKYLDSFINYEKTPPHNYSRAFKLERMRSLLARIEDPQKGLNVIHIAGTKGKGSTAALIASVLKESGFHTGLYTSPHLISFRERIRFDGTMIEEEELCRLVAGVKPHLEEMRKENLSFFEAYTAIAFLYFKEKRVDFAVVETGLGGRLDATNAAEGKVEVITPISLEHTHILGFSLEEIAREKAGIIKEGSIVISAPQEREALDVIKGVCLEKGVPLRLVGRDIFIEKGRFDEDRQHFSVWAHLTEYPLLELSLKGEHQIINAATAIGALEALVPAYNLFIPTEILRMGISKAEWPGRMELLHRDPALMVDGAQNVASAQALVNGLRRHLSFRRLILILGISRDKDIEGICSTLSEIAHSIILTHADNPRAADPRVLKRYFKGKICEVFLNSKDALRFAYSKAERGDLILATGSLFLVGEIKEMIESEKRKAQSAKLLCPSDLEAREA